MNDAIKGALVAAAVTAMFGCGSSQPRPAASGDTTTGTSVHCQGINECRGRAECSGNGHPCGQHTPCRGQGWITVESAQECTTRGGTVL